MSYRIVAFALLMIVAACGRGLDEAAPGTTTSTTATSTTTTQPVVDTAVDTVPPPPADPVVLWVDAERAEAVRQAAAEFTTTVGIEVDIVETEVDDIGDTVLAAILADEGPDIFIGRHDWIGALAPEGAIAPVGLGARIDEFLDVAGTAFTLGGEVYGVPVSASAPALITNQDLIPTTPIGFAQIKNSCEELGEAIDNCLIIDSGDPSLLLPFLVGQGGYLLGEDEEGPDLDDVGIDNDGSRAGAQFLRDLIRDDVIDAGGGAGGAIGTFTGSLAPYTLGDVDTARVAVRRGIPATVSALPLTGGDSPVPLIPVDGFFLNGRSSAPDAAGTLLRDFLATASTMQAIADASGQVSAHAETAAAAAAGDEIMAVYVESVSAGRPLPAVAELDAVLAAVRPALAGLFGADIDIAALLSEAADGIRAAVGVASS